MARKPVYWPQFLLHPPLPAPGVSKEWEPQGEPEEQDPEAPKDPKDTAQAGDPEEGPKSPICE